MIEILNAVEVRIIGSLIEKQVATPEYYPLTLNALVAACNQTSNRDPVLTFDDRGVARALEILRDRKMVHTVYGSDSRVPRYRQVLTEFLALTPAEVAVMCVLMLRGAQTAGEIKGRTNRLYEFADLAEAEATLDKLIAREPDALVVRLPRQPGQKEVRYAHLLAGPVTIEEWVGTPRLEAATIEVQAENERLAKLEAEVTKLRGEVAELRGQLNEFRKQFE